MSPKVHILLLITNCFCFRENKKRHHFPLYGALQAHTHRHTRIKNLQIRFANLGGGPPEKVRRNRVVITLTDAELAKLHRLAERKDLPLGTAAYEIVARALARQR